MYIKKQINQYNGGKKNNHQNRKARQLQIRMRHF